MWTQFYQQKIFDCKHKENIFLQIREFLTKNLRNDIYGFLDVEQLRVDTGVGLVQVEQALHLVHLKPDPAANNSQLEDS